MLRAVGCPGASAIAVFVGGPRDDAAAAGAIEGHLAECGACRRLVAALTLTSGAAVTADEREPPRLVAAGAAIGRYQVRDVLGAGAMGVVYAARDPELERDVAIKVLHPGLAGRLDLLAEAQAMARIRHPNVVAVHDAGSDGDRLYVAMELVAGTNLRAWLGGGPPWREIVRVMIAAGRGLAAAHALGLVHRDFKPENVLLGAADQVCVTDFGLACAAGARTDVAGTPAYIAPEHLAGAPPAASADQYSFCKVLGEAVGDAHGAPAWLAAIARRGTAMDPAARFPAMTAVVDALERRRARRIARGVAAGAVAAITAAAVIALVRDPSRGAVDGDPCRGVAAAAPASVADAAAVRAAFAGRDTEAVDGGAAAADRARGTDRGAAFVDGPAAVSDRAAARVTAWRARWSAMRVEACRANRVAGAESDELFDLRIACLDERARDLAAVVDQLAVAPAPSAARALDAVEQAARLDTCADGKALLAPLRLPADPAERAGVIAMRGALATARAMHRLGRDRDATALAAQIAADATSPAAAMVRAEALHVVARARSALASDTVAAGAAWTAAGAAIDDALLAAEVAGHDRLRADLYLARASLLEVHDDRAAAARDRTQARALIARLGDGPLAEQLAMDDGWTALDAGDLATGVPLLEALAAIQIARDGGPDPITAELWTRIGVAYLDADQPAHARPHLTRARVALERLLGDAHPALVRALIGLGDAASAEGDPAGAVTVLSRALAIADATAGAVPEEAVAQVAASLSLARAALGDHAAAVALIDRALAVYAPAVPDAGPPVALFAALNYAQLATMRAVIRAGAGDPGALADSDRALAALDRANAPPAEHAAALAGRGTAYRRLGRFDAARGAYDLAATLDPDPVTRFAAARGLTDLAAIQGAVESAQNRSARPVQRQTAFAPSAESTSGETR
jgi:tetratricopeptide (TPR) repeat protein